MFEGKHIHFSPVDQKPLCSFSNKLCRQRRLNGFAFCIRHILEDPSAPFKVCSFIASPGQSKCTNVISVAHPKGLCNTHLQQAGYPTVKRDRKNCKKEGSLCSSDFSTNEKSISQSDHNSSIEMSDGDPCSLSDDPDPITKNDSVNCENYRKPAVMNSPIAVEPLTPSSTSSSVDSNLDGNFSKTQSSTFLSLPVNQKPKSIKSDLKTKTAGHPKKKRCIPGSSLTKMTLKHLPVALQRLENALNEHKSQFLLPKEIDDSDDEESVQLSENLPRYLSTVLLRSSSEAQRSLRSGSEKMEYRNRYLRLSKLIDADKRLRGLHQVSLGNKLVEAARACPDTAGLILQGRNFSSFPGTHVTNMKIFKKRRCSFKRASSIQNETDSKCLEYCLPCSTLCSRHILYSVDQQLFEFCSARSSGGSMPCGAPVLAIHSGLPYCATHIREAERMSSSTPTGLGSSGTAELINNTGSNQTGSNTSKTTRRKTRSRSTSSLGRHSRRLRNRRKAKRIGGGSETRINCIDVADNGIELDVETVDSPETCSPAYPTPAQLTPHSVNAGTVPITSPIDHEVEILEDNDLKELLNRLPDEAFQEIFAMTQAATSTRNGSLFATTREEAEELERALAVEGVPMPLIDKYSTLGGVGNAETDLSDLIDDHTLALAHDIIAMGAGTSAQTMLLGTGEPITSNHLYMDTLSIPHAAVSHPGFQTEVVSSSPTLSRRKSLPLIPASSQGSPARGSSPPSLEQHQHDSSFIEGRDSVVAHPM